MWVFESSKSDFLIFSYNFYKMTIESAQAFLTNQLNLGFGAFLRGLESSKPSISYLAEKL